MLSAADDADNAKNVAPDDVAGYNVNTIAIEIPIDAVDQRRATNADSEPYAAIGTYGTTSRQQITVRRAARRQPPNLTHGPFRQVQRMGNPLINELIIGTGSKDRFSMDDPKNDSQFASFFLRRCSPPSSGPSACRCPRHRD